MHAAVPRLARAALAAVRVPEVVPDLLHGETVLAVVVRHGPGAAAARQRVADPDLDVAVGRRLHGRERGQPLVLRGRHDEVAAALLARRLHLVVGAHVGRDPQAGVIGGLFRVAGAGERGVGERDVGERHFGGVPVPPRIPDVDRRVRHCVDRRPRRSADGDAVDVHCHLVALDDNSDLVGHAGRKGDARRRHAPLADVIRPRGPHAAAVGLHHVQGVLSLVKPDARQPLVIQIADAEDGLPMARTEAGRPVARQLHRERELVVLERVDGGDLVARGGDDGTGDVEHTAVAAVVGGGRLLRVVVGGGRGERAAAAGAALVPRREVAVVVVAAFPLVTSVPRAVVAEGIRGRSVVDAGPGVVVARGAVVVVAVVVVPARGGAGPAARGLARAVRGLPDGPVVGAPLRHPADRAARRPGARAVLVAAGRVLEDVRRRRDAVLVHVGGVRRQVAGVLGARHGDVPSGEALLGRAGEARESAAVVGRLRGGRRDRARREDRRPPHHLAVLHCGATVFCLAVGRGCPSDSHQLPRTVSWMGATHRRGALRGHGHMVGALPFSSVENLVCRHSLAVKRCPH